MTSGRFAIAAHALALLAITPGGMSSDDLAKSVNTHPVFLRRIMTALGRAGLVAGREGRAGGYRLARDASSITLADVFAAVEPPQIAPAPTDPNAVCVLSAGMRGAFDEIARAADAGMREALGRRTVAELAARALDLGRHAG
ncbi:MAG TPA: Rrf2 family transcriptional regulator [Minicystis sp.]|nr:Rrf2 family transcriptional regulator [Minicystis sp.]